MFNHESIRAILARIEATQKKELTLMSLLDDGIAKIQADVSAITGAVSTAITNLGALAQQIADLKAQLAGAGVSQAQLDALSAISASIESETAALAAAAPSAP